MGIYTGKIKEKHPSVYFLRSIQKEKLGGKKSARSIFKEIVIEPWIGSPPSTIAEQENYQGRNRQASKCKGLFKL